MVVHEKLLCSKLPTESLITIALSLSLSIDNFYWRSYTVLENYSGKLQASKTKTQAKMTFATFAKLTAEILGLYML